MKITKIFATLIIVVTILATLSNVVMAAINPDTYKPNETMIGGNVSSITTSAGKILNAIRIIGTVISVGAIIWLGIKYLIGSVEEKAEYKKSMIPMIVGIVILFSITNLVAIIYNFIAPNVNV